MKRFHSVSQTIGLSVALPVALTFSGLAQAAMQAAPAPEPRSSTTMPRWASDDPIANEGVIEDGAIDAIKEMSNYLMSLNTIGITTQGSMDAVTADGQRIQMEGTTTYLSDAMDPPLCSALAGLSGSERPARRSASDRFGNAIQSPLLLFRPSGEL